MVLQIIMLVIAIAFIVIQCMFLGKKKLLGLLLPLICFIGSIGILVSQPAITNLISDGFTNGSHYYSVTVEKDNSQSQHIFQNKNDEKEFVNSLDSKSLVLEETEIERTKEWYMFLGEFLFITNIPTIILLIIYMRKQIWNYIDKKEEQESL
ncbi:hypothetical protein [Ruminococcus sp.]|nr:hypothetical protein [Ruminococcus sp.]MEE3439594.1 hypothetical protein [Ruminococcus sp.]